MLDKLKIFTENPEYFITSPAAKGLLNWVPDAVYIKILYRIKMGQSCNLKNPKKYNEKLQWLKLHDHKPEYQQMVDKYDVRKYISQVLGEEYLVPIYGVYHSFDEIDFDQLPEQFVLKCTHDSGSVAICKDKSQFKREAVKARFEKAMKKNYYAAYREWPYKKVKSRIIAEKYIWDDESNDLKDYKIMCFHGKAELAEIHENRFEGSDSHTQTFYDRNWNKLEIAQDGLNPTKEVMQKPELMDEIFRLSEILAKDMIHVRIDWYIANHKIYFGEITFYDGSGFEPFSEKDDLLLGNYIHLD